MDLKTIRSGLKNAINAVEGLTASDLRPDPNPPCALVYPKDVPYDLTFDGGARLHFTVMVLVPFANVESGQDALDAYLSDQGVNSIKVAIEKDQTLEGVVSDCIVIGVEGYRPMALVDGGIQYLSAELLVEVWT